MANQKLFCLKKNEEFERVGSSMSTNFKFDGQTLTIEWKGIHEEYPAKIGDAFNVKCSGGFPEVKKISLPKNRTDKILWLLGFFSQSRAKTEEEFYTLLKKRREEFEWANYQEYGIRLEKKAHLVICNRIDCGGYYHVAGWINENLTNQEIIDIMLEFLDGNRTLVAPKEWVATIIENELKIKVSL